MKDIAVRDTMQSGIDMAQLESVISPIPYNPVSGSTDQLSDKLSQPLAPTYSRVLQSPMNGKSYHLTHSLPQLFSNCTNRYCNSRSCKSATTINPNPENNYNSVIYLQYALFIHPECESNPSWRSTKDSTTPDI